VPEVATSGTYLLGSIPYGKTFARVKAARGLYIEPLKRNFEKGVEK